MINKKITIIGTVALVLFIILWIIMSILVSALNDKNWEMLLITAQLEEAKTKTKEKENIIKEDKKEEKEIKEMTIKAKEIKIQIENYKIEIKEKTEMVNYLQKKYELNIWKTRCIAKNVELGLLSKKPEDCTKDLNRFASYNLVK